MGMLSVPEQGGFGRAVKTQNATFAPPSTPPDTGRSFTCCTYQPHCACAGAFLEPPLAPLAPKSVASPATYFATDIYT